MAHLDTFQKAQLRANILRCNCEVWRKIATGKMALVTNGASQEAFGYKRLAVIRPESKQAAQ